MKWISVKERLPEMEGNDWSERIIVYNGEVIDNCRMEVRKEYNYRTYKFEPKSFDFYFHPFGYDYDSYEIEGVTHWMPLPDPPLDFNDVVERNETLDLMNSIKDAQNEPAGTWEPDENGTPTLNIFIDENTEIEVLVPEDMKKRLESAPRTKIRWRFDGDGVSGEIIEEE